MANLFELSFTRPENTTPYGAGDVIGIAAATPANAGSAVHRLSSGGPPAGGLLVKITSTELLVGLDTVPAGMTSLTMHLYSASPPSALLDNAAWDLPAGDRSVYLGSVTMGTPVDLGGTIYIQTASLAKNVRLASDGSLYAYLVTVAGYTPASATAMLARIYAERSL